MMKIMMMTVMSEGRIKSFLEWKGNLMETYSKKLNGATTFDR